MICINCCCSVESVYIIYPGNHIKLTDCPKCQEVVDKYVEFDSVLLFIDLLLLKPCAYRHLVYNSLENNLSKYPKWINLTNVVGFGNKLKLLIFNLENWCSKFDKLNRIWLLLITFEIYLTWVYEEKKYTYSYNNYPSDFKLTIKDILQLNPFSQYKYFAIYVILDIALLHNMIQYFLMKWCKWGSNVKYAGDVISYTILLSYGANIFPILMLIWPYDTLLSTSIIKWIANIYIIESLRFVTGINYFKILLGFTIVFLTRFLLLKLILAFILADGYIPSFLEYLKGEYHLFLYRFVVKKHFFL